MLKVRTEIAAFAGAFALMAGHASATESPGSSQIKPPANLTYEQRLAATCATVTRFIKDINDLGVSIAKLQLKPEMSDGSGLYDEKFSSDIVRRCDSATGRLRPASFKKPFQP